MCCSVLQCVAVDIVKDPSLHDDLIYDNIDGVFGSVWQYVAVCGSVLQYVALCCSALQCLQYMVQTE